MKATVNRVPFTGNNAISYLVGPTILLNGGPYYDTTFLNTIISFSFITKSLTPATYPIENFKLNVWVDSLHVNPVPAAYGVVNITSVSPDIAGTFSFTCTDSTQVTNGSFVAKHY